MEVYNQLGHGFLEAVYQDALEIELSLRDIPFVAQPQLQIIYKNQILNSHYIADILVFDQIILELKAIKELSTLETAQLLNELKASNHLIGLLINFGNLSKLEWKRIVLTPKEKIRVN